MINPSTGLPVGPTDRYIEQDRVFWDSQAVPAGTGQKKIIYFKEVKSDYSGNIPTPGGFGSSISFSCQAIAIVLKVNTRIAPVPANFDRMADVIYGGSLEIKQDVSSDAIELPLAMLLVPNSAGTNPQIIDQNFRGLKILNRPVIFSGGSISPVIRLDLLADSSIVDILLGLYGFFASNPRQ